MKRTGESITPTLLSFLPSLHHSSLYHFSLTPPTKQMQLAQILYIIDFLIDALISLYLNYNPLIALSADLLRSQFVCLFIILFTHSFSYVLIYLFTYLFIHSFIYSSIYLSEHIQIEKHGQQAVRLYESSGGEGDSRIWLSTQSAHDRHASAEQYR